LRSSSGLLQIATLLLNSFSYSRIRTILQHVPVDLRNSGARLRTGSLAKCFDSQQIKRQFSPESGTHRALTDGGKDGTV
jgi:hypothetical protein